MKSEHRHELQTNALGKYTWQAWEWLEKHANQVMIVVCAVSLVAAGLIYWSKASRAKQEEAWRELANAAALRKADDFAAVWENYPGTVVSQWARLQEGEARLAEGVQLSFRNLVAARKELQQAKEALQTIVDQKSALAAIRERALFSLGRCLESLSDGNESDAVKTYQALLREFPGSIFRQDVEQRIAALESGRGQEFYAWFASYPRPKAPEKRPHDRTTTDDDLMPGLEDEAADPAGQPGPKLDLPDDEPQEPAADANQPSEAESSAAPVP